MKIHEGKNTLSRYIHKRRKYLLKNYLMEYPKISKNGISKNLTEDVHKWGNNQISIFIKEGGGNKD